MDQKKRLDQAQIKWRDMCDCSLRNQCTQAVFGEGNAEADIVFIGEAPGKNEDIQGRPFIGAAGKFLSEMLAIIGLKREDVYITNIVKYRPPENRDPVPEEIEACSLWLYEELSIIDPKLIVMLGRHALEHFVPGKKISEAHGKTFRLIFNGRERSFFALYHPAAALYNGGMRQTLIEDFKKISKVISKMEK
jgi:uracil-DNA glycosylase